MLQLISGKIIFIQNRISDLLEDIQYLPGSLDWRYVQNGTVKQAGGLYLWIYLCPVVKDDLVANAP